MSQEEFPAISAFDTKRLLQSERLFNKNTHRLTFAFDRIKDFDKLTDTERENIYRKIDKLPLLVEPVKIKVSRTRSKAPSAQKRRYI